VPTLRIMLLIFCVRISLMMMMLLLLLGGMPCRSAACWHCCWYCSYTLL
jgi:hypothetical protein